MVYAARYLLIVLYTIFWGTLGSVIGLLDRSGNGVIWVGRNWISWILATCRITIEADGLETLDTRVPYVLMSNHQSVFDIAAIVTSWPVDFRFVAKRELTWGGSGSSTARRFRPADDRGELKQAVRAAIEQGLDHALQSEPTRDHAA